MQNTKISQLPYVRLFRRTVLMNVPQGEIRSVTLSSLLQDRLANPVTLVSSTFGVNSGVRSKRDEKVGVAVGN